LWCLLVWLLPATTIAAPEAGFRPEEAGAGSLLLRMQSGYRPATRINTDVDIEVSGITLRATVRQVFRNDGAEWVEGVYVFPLPDGAAVDRMRLVVGDRVIEGEIREKQAAQQEYEQARRDGKRAGLVRQERANLFTTAVANVAPGETVTIEIGYLDTAGYDDGTYSLRFPMTMTPRYIPGRPSADRQGSGWSPDTDRVPDASMITPPVVATSRDHRVSLSASINLGVPLELVASRYHPVDVEETADGYRASLAHSGVAMDHDFELIWRPVRAQAPRAMAFTETVDDRPHLLVMIVPPDDDVSAIEIPPRDLVFVIDTSGSMHGVSIEQARKALLLAIDGLRPVDRFNVIQFNSVTRSLFADSVPATANNIGRAQAYVAALGADGGTEMRPALELALGRVGDSAFLRQVIFITDGSVGNETELFRVIEDRLGGTRLFTVGIGSAPNSWFMRKSAEVGRGASITISALHEVEEKMGRLFRKLERPMLTDLQMGWPTDLAAETYPATIPDLYAGEPVVIRARLAREPKPGDQLVIDGRLAGGGWRVELPLADAAPGPGTASVWARAHVAALMDRERRGVDAESVRAEVIDTALAHQIVTRHTSLVAVDRTPVRPSASGLAREQVPSLLPHGQSMKAIFGFPATATSAPVYRRNGALLLGLGALILFFNVWATRGRDRGED
jgi:Ca-activated chloride channel family protein